jgi:hypothetical protein
MLKTEEAQCLQKRQELDDQLCAQVWDLEARHQRERAKFEDDWADPASLIAFHKPSGHLLSLRASEQKLACLGDFRGAEELRRHIAKKERAETEAAQRKAKAGVKAAFDQLVKQQEKELDGHRTLDVRVRFQLQTQIDHELNPIRMAIKKLEARQEQPPPPRRCPKVSRSPLVQRRNPEPGDDRPGASTPRTVRRLATVKASPRTLMLPLKPVETKAMVKAASARPKTKPKVPPAGF